MNKLSNILIAFALGAAAVSSQAAPSVLGIRDSIRDNAIIYPESFERDVRRMQDDWYLRRYAALDDKADTRSSVEATDREIIERLQAMPTTIEMPYNSVVR